MKRLTADEFDSAAKGFQSSETVKAYARRVLVGGENAATVAREFKISRQAVSAQVSRFYAYWQKEAAEAAGWEVVTVRLPPNVADVVKRMERQQLKRLESAGCKQDG